MELPLILISLPCGSVLLPQKEWGASLCWCAPCLKRKCATFPKFTRVLLRAGSSFSSESNSFPWKKLPAHLNWSLYPSISANSTFLIRKMWWVLVIHTILTPPTGSFQKTHKSVKLRFPPSHREVVSVTHVFRYFKNNTLWSCLKSFQSLWSDN